MPLPQPGKNTQVLTYVYTCVALPGKTKQGLVDDFVDIVHGKESLARDGTGLRVGAVMEPYKNYRTKHKFHFHLVFQFKTETRWKFWVNKLYKLGYPGKPNFYPHGCRDKNWAKAKAYLTDPKKDKVIDVGGLFGYELSAGQIAKEKYEAACRKACCSAALGHYWKGSPLVHHPSCFKAGRGAYPYITPGWQS